MASLSLQSITGSLTQAIPGQAGQALSAAGLGLASQPLNYKGFTLSPTINPQSLLASTVDVVQNGKVLASVPYHLDLQNPKNWDIKAKQWVDQYLASIASLPPAQSTSVVRPSTVVTMPPTPWWRKMLPFAPLALFAVVGGVIVYKNLKKPKRTPSSTPAPAAG